jgi:hypothetical protein
MPAEIVKYSKMYREKTLTGATDVMESEPIRIWEGIHHDL